ncbi:hypothetical protein DFJ58DRAFT_727397 [Suillus subalutaceus]|uniref:uncharacterized protein n=1 Tax=Suillus subalutaceus TaxID=48586 RepID=UPI001B876B5C|nr:uncharacterized protein DFJ58DRAFT_727397 [Suillus subalutaceus]KAG1855738.1 hypothetical protein DFJ58DRAFT_727397 [Suillus subalutaceus]
MNTPRARYTIVPASRPASIPPVHSYPRLPLPSYYHHGNMLRRPPAIAPEVWDSWPDSLKRTIAETPEVYMAPANSNIDPALLSSSNSSSAPRHTPRDANRDGPHEPMLFANPSAANNGARRLTNSSDTRLPEHRRHRRGAVSSSRRSWGRHQRSSSPSDNNREREGRHRARSPVHNHRRSSSSPSTSRSSSRNNRHSRRASSPATRHSTPANMEDLAAILCEMRENQDEHYKQTDERLAQLEGNVPSHQTSTRGRIVQSRGASLVARRRRRRGAGAEVDGVESRAGEFDHDAEDVTGARGSLSTAAREARGHLKHLVTAKFRHVCDVSDGKKWPSLEVERKNDMTGEVYLTPNFEATVNDDHNRVIFKKIAHLVWEELGSTTLSDSLSNRKVKWNKQSLFTFAKDTYRGFKEEWKAQNDREKAAAKNNNQQKNRWSQRRKEKADRLTTACPKYLELHGVDPINIIHADHMSDEASGPEDDGESVDE